MINFDIDSTTNELSISFDDKANPVSELQGYLFASDYMRNPVLSTLNATVCTLFNCDEFDFCYLSELEYAGNDCAGYTITDVYNEQSYFIDNYDISKLLENGEVFIPNKFDDTDYRYSIACPWDDDCSGLEIGTRLHETPTIYALKYKDANTCETVEKWFSLDSIRQEFADDHNINISANQISLFPEMQCDIVTFWDDLVIDGTTTNAWIDIAFENGVI